MMRLEDAKRKISGLHEALQAAFLRADATIARLQQRQEGAKALVDVDVTAMKQKMRAQLVELSNDMQLKTMEQMERIQIIGANISDCRKRAQDLIYELNAAMSLIPRDSRRLDDCEAELGRTLNILEELDEEVGRIKTQEINCSLLLNFDRILRGLVEDGTYFLRLCSSLPTALRLSVLNALPIVQGSDVLMRVTGTDAAVTFEHFLEVKVVHESGCEEIAITKKFECINDSRGLTVGFFASLSGKYLVRVNLYGQHIEHSPVEISVARFDVETELQEIEQMDRRSRPLTRQEIDEYNRLMYSMIPPENRQGWGPEEELPPPVERDPSLHVVAGALRSDGTLDGADSIRLDSIDSHDLSSFSSWSGAISQVGQHATVQLSSVAESDVLIDGTAESLILTALSHDTQLVTTAISHLSFASTVPSTSTQSSHLTDLQQYNPSITVEHTVQSAESYFGDVFLESAHIQAMAPRPSRSDSSVWD